MADGKVQFGELPQLVSLLMRSARQIRVPGKVRRGAVVCAAIRIYEKESGKEVPQAVRDILPSVIDAMYAIGGKKMFGKLRSSCCCCCR
jgi:hypothetical protein